MMQLECWNIQGASFHFGTHGLGQEQTMVTMPSDSLFGALVARLARTHGPGSDEERVIPSTFRWRDFDFCCADAYSEEQVVERRT
jgi:CRISPR/Cas system CSM-associated protein Csm4 (group 5 of RAMP superfamily)